MLHTGAYCAGNGDKLYHDIASKQEKRDRRKDAGCIVSGGNRCSTKKKHKAGFECDEFPYASSKPKGSTTHRLNKCVPAKENHSMLRIIPRIEAREEKLLTRLNRAGQQTECVLPKVMQVQGM
jgi:hypothetical protein